MENTVNKYSVLPIATEIEFLIFEFYLQVLPRNETGMAHIDVYAPMLNQILINGTQNALNIWSIG